MRTYDDVGAKRSCRAGHNDVVAVCPSIDRLMTVEVAVLFYHRSRAILNTRLLFLGLSCLKPRDLTRHQVQGGKVEDEVATRFTALQIKILQDGISNVGGLQRVHAKAEKMCIIAERHFPFLKRDEL